MNGKTRALSALTVALASLAALSSAAAGPPENAETVVEVRVEGSRHRSVEAVLSDVKVRVGQKYDEGIVAADVKRLSETGRYVSVRATKARTAKGWIVTFVLVERPLVAKLVFQGNKAFKDSDLAGELTFRASEALNRFAIETGRQAILTKYHSSGYHVATVTVDEKALAERREVIYRIVEGPRVTIRKVRFKGNKYFSYFQLLLKIGTRGRFWPFITGYLDTEQLERDVHDIRNLYVNEGFLDAEVGRLLEFFDEKKLKVTFVIKEGPRYRVNRVTLKGNTVFSDEELLKRLKLTQGRFFTALDLRRDTKRLRDTYGRLGYVGAAVAPRKQFVDPTAPPPDWARGLPEGTPALLNIIYELQESDQYKVGRVDISGNTVTQGRVIRRVLKIFPEQLFDTVAAEQSRRRLMETGFFEKVTITPTGKEPKVRNALVQVTEGKTAHFLIGVGVSTNTGVLGNISFTQRNFDILAWPKSWRQFIYGNSFKGAGQTFSVVAEPGTELMRYHVEWTEPYLFDTPYSLSTRAFLFTRAREAYDETRYGGVVSVGHRFKNRWYGELATRLEGVEIDDLDTFAPSEIRGDAGTHFLLGEKGTLVRDRTDSRWLPSTGDRFRFSYEQVVGSYQFGRALGDYRIYRTVYVDPLDRKHILAGRAAVGQIFGDAPVFERFYGGGLGSVRGFEYRGISPRAMTTDDPIGGDFMTFVGGEYTFPIFGRPTETGSGELRGVVFVDSGTVEENFEVTTYRLSAGVGLRWVIPFFGPVPMSFDFGFPISKDEDDDTEVFSFSIGWTF